MSQAAFSESKQARRQCLSCGARKARFRYRGAVKADRDHTLCFECFRAERNRRRARLLASVPSARALKATLDEVRRVNSTCQDLPGATKGDLHIAGQRDFRPDHISSYCRVGRRVV